MSDNDTLRPEDFEQRAEPSSAKPNFKTAINQNPVLRLGVIILPVIVIVVGILVLFGGSKKAPIESRVDRGSDIKNTTGEGASNPEYLRRQEEDRQQQKAQAEANNKSLIATTAPATTKPTAPKPEDDPIKDFVTTPVVPPSTTPVKPVPLAGPPQQVAPAQPRVLDQQLAQSFGTEMRTIIGGLNPKPVVITKVTTHIEDILPSANGAATSQAQGTGSAASKSSAQSPIVISAGTVIYGQTLTEANSDIPAPILVSVLSGPLQGGRAIGTFQKSDEYLILAFGTIIKNKKEYKVNAIAIDPETTLTGLATDVDHHYFERFVLPAAAGFISGVGTYTQQAGSAVTYSTYGVSQSYPPLNTHQEALAGLGQGANAIANAIQQESNVPITIHVASGTPIGIMFVNSVHEATQ